MTRIILVIETDDAVEPDVYSFDDPRSHRELIKAVNTGVESAVLLPEYGRACLIPAPRGHEPQWAVSHEPVDTVTIMERRPPVQLSARQYDVLFCLADGLGMPQIARRLRISVRTGYMHLAELKQRFEVQSTAQLVAVAIIKRMLPAGSESAGRESARRPPVRESITY